jgi:hypothetical protein
LHYLGGIRGAGILTCGDETVARADYDFDGYLMKPDQVTGCGEIRMSPEALKQVFGRSDLQLLTDDGRRLRVQFTERQLRSASEVAHVNVAGELPSASEWRH